MNPKVKAVQVLPDYVLELEFTNGEIGHFSMASYLDYPVYEPLKNYDLFKQARAVMGFVSWNEDIDMSPDSLYLGSKMIAHL